VEREITFVTSQPVLLARLNFYRDHYPQGKGGIFHLAGRQDIAVHNLKILRVVIATVAEIQDCVQVPTPRLKALSCPPSPFQAATHIGRKTPFHLILGASTHPHHDRDIKSFLIHIQRSTLVGILSAFERAAYSSLTKKGQWFTQYIQHFGGGHVSFTGKHHILGLVLS